MRRVRWPSTTAAAARFQSPCSGSFSLSLSSLSESKRIASSHVCSPYPSSAWRAWCFELLARENEEEEEEEGVELLRFFSSSSFDSTSARLALFFRRTSSEGKKKGRNNRSRRACSRLVCSLSTKSACIDRSVIESLVLSSRNTSDHINDGSAAAPMSILSSSSSARKTCLARRRRAPRRRAAPADGPGLLRLRSGGRGHAQGEPDLLEALADPAEGLGGRLPGGHEGRARVLLSTSRRRRKR